MAPAPRTHFSRAWPSEGAQPLLALPYMLRTCQARVAIAARAPIPAAMSARELRPRVGSQPRCPPRAVPGSAPPPPRAPAALKAATAGARVGPGLGARTRRARGGNTAYQ